MPCPCEGLRCKLGALDGRHGSKYGYAKLGCRCGACRAANTAAKAVYREANREALRVADNRRNAHARRKAPPKLGKPLPEVLLAGALLADRTSYAEVARTVGWHPETVARMFPGRGWESAEVTAYARLHSTTTPLAPAKPDAEVAAAGELLAEGHSYAEVARRIGWAPATVANYHPGQGWDAVTSARHARAARAAKARAA